MRRSLALAALLFAAPIAVQAEPSKYLVLISGQPSGEMVVEVGSNRREVRYSYSDRGRGPALTMQADTGADLTPTQMRIQGVDYLKLAVDERFEATRSGASWRSASDQGQTTGGGFYFPKEATPEHLAMLTRALLKAPGRELALLPAGRAGLESLSQVNGSDGAVYRLYAISGLGFGPRAVWLDDAGELVMAGDDWSATVREDAQGQARALIAAQAQALSDRAAARSHTLMRRPSGPLALRDVALFDPQTRSLRPAATVVLQGGRIVAVGPSATTSIPAGAEVIEGAGRTLLPGLFDMHVHVSADDQGLLHLAAGVTSTRDLANNGEELTRRRARFDAGALPGPRIYAAGFIDGPGPLAGPIKVLVSTPEEMRAAIGDYADYGYRQIKLYSSLDPKLIPVAAEEARRRGLRVSGHVPAGMTMSQAVEAGYDEVHHLNFAALNFMGPEINAKTNGITRITAIAEHAGELDLESAETARFLALLKAHGTVVDPTMSLYENHLMGRSGRVTPNLKAVIDRLPPVVRRSSFGAGLARSDAEEARNAAAYRKMQGLLLKLHQAGVPLVPGTDDMAGFTYLRELELYVEAGIPAADVLYMATLGSARVLGVEAQLGSLAPGKLADMVLVDGDPTRSIGDVRRAVLVIKDGTLFDPTALLAEVGVTPP